jgi:hypothetical protein
VVALALAVVVARAAVPAGFGMLSWKPPSKSRSMFARRSLSSDGIMLTELSSNPCRRVGLAAVRSLSLCRAAFEPYRSQPPAQQSHSQRCEHSVRRQVKCNARHLLSGH